MTKAIGLAVLALACAANAMQLPGMWDIFDIAAPVLAAMGFALCLPTEKDA